MASLLGCRQVVRHWVLIPAFRGSNPCTPASFSPQSALPLPSISRYNSPTFWSRKVCLLNYFRRPAMSAVSFELVAKKRDDLGKSASRRLRRENKVLGVVYGGDEAATAITLEQNIVFKATENEAFYTKLLSLTVDGKKQQVILRDMQRHPYKPVILHMDFLRVKATDKINMMIPLHFIGEDDCPGVKDAGGVFNHSIAEIEVRCLAGNIPEFISVDVSKMQLDETIMLSQVAAPAGVEFTLLAHDHDPAVCGVHMPRQPAVEEETPVTEVIEGEEGAATAEGEEGAAAAEAKAPEGKHEGKHDEGKHGDKK